MKVSVVIPCFNRERQLGAAIESALNQSEPPTDIIVVDDGSTDRSAEIAATYGARVRVIRTCNNGPSAARNIGIRAAEGEWIAFLDSDDVWDREKLKQQARAARAFPEADLIFCDTVVKKGDEVRIASRFALGGLYGREVCREGDFALYDRSLFISMLEQSRCITSAVLVRRDLPELEFPEQIREAEDWALWLKLALRYRFASVDRKLVTMHDVGDNLTRNTTRLLRNAVLVLQELLSDPVLSEHERIEVQRVLERFRVGAVYHSLVQAETREARKILKDICSSSLPLARRMRYWCATFVPKHVLRAIGRRQRRRDADVVRD